MTNSQRLAAVRRCLDRWLENQQPGGDLEISDAVLIRAGFYVGRTFQLGPYRAVWFMEDDEVKIHDAAGAVVAKFDAAAIDVGSRLTSSAETRVQSTEQESTGVATIPMQRPIPEPANEVAAVRRAA